MQFVICVLLLAEFHSNSSQFNHAESKLNLQFVSVCSNQQKSLSSEAVAAQSINLLTFSSFHWTRFALRNSILLQFKAARCVTGQPRSCHMESRDKWADQDWRSKCHNPATQRNREQRSLSSLQIVAKASKFKLRHDESSSRVVKSLLLLMRSVTALKF